MDIRCPFCNFHIVIKGLKPGGYHPPCPGCKERFYMVVARIDGHRFVLLGESMDTLKPVYGLERLRRSGQATRPTPQPKPSPKPKPSPPPTVASDNDDDDEVFIDPIDDDSTAKIATDSDPSQDSLAAEQATLASTRRPAAPGRTGTDDDDEIDPFATGLDDEDSAGNLEATLDAIAGELGDDADNDDDEADETVASSAPKTPTPETSASEQTQSAIRPSTPPAKPRHTPKPKPKPTPTPQQTATQHKPAARQPAPSAAASTPPAPSEALTGRLDGYEIIDLLGRGGMGSVYLARQLSLDRLVAIKTINPEWANDPIFLSRFTREAYAAAQLSHHNVVQIHDIGEDRGTHYFSMEYVDGRSLADVVKQHGPLDVEEAAGYILHAARGLKFAHDHDMVHRDIKPANLLLNDEGVVKIADLGLVKTANDGSPANGKSNASQAAANASLTSQNAMGTPAYMAPEQIENPAGVDGRADIYSLGCTFYVLTTGRPVFEGNTAEEVMTKHATEAVIPPEKIAKRVPQSISSIIMNMVAKDPADRYADMQTLVGALEDFLGISAGPFTPREEHAQTLEQAVQSFYASPRARLRRWLVLAFTLLCVLGGAWGLITARPTWVLAAAGLWFFTGVGYAALAGITQRTAVAGKVRQLIFSSGLRDWLAWTLTAVVVVAALVFFNLHMLTLAVLIVGVGLAAAFHFSIDWLVTRERRPHVQAVRDMLKQLRLRGLEEDAVRRFICRYSGRDWEAFYEALFGYEAKLYARQHWGHDDDGRPRRKYGVWRDGLIQWIDQRLQRREEAKRRKHLQKIEARRLKAEGKSEAEAKHEADTVARTMVSHAAAYKQTGQWQGKASAAADGDAPAISTTLRTGPGIVSRLLNLLLGGRARLVAGLALLAAYVMWAREHDFASRMEADPGLLQTRRLLNESFDPLQLPGVPVEVMRLLSTHGAGLAGLLLVLSAFHVGKKMTLFVLPAVAVLIAGPLLPVPDLWVLSPTELTLAAGLALAIAGWWLGRSRLRNYNG